MYMNRMKAVTRSQAGRRARAMAGSNAPLDAAMDAAADSAQARKKKSSTAPGSVGAAHLQSFTDAAEHIAEGVGKFRKKRQDMKSKMKKAEGVWEQSLMGRPHYSRPAPAKG